MPWLLTAPIFTLDDTQTCDTQGRSGGREPLDVPIVKRAPIFSQWPIQPEWTKTRKSDLSTILFENRYRGLIGIKKRGWK